MYKSTRYNDEPILKPASSAIIDGIASNGGLYVPTSIPTIDINELKTLTYQQLAIKVLSKYLDDFSLEQIEKVVYKAYDTKFDTDNIVEIKKINDCNVLELYHGPTLSFKDVALSALPLLLDESKIINNHNNNTIILTATSGDTGSGALSGFSQSPNVKMVVFYPTEGVSKIQERQMLSFKGNKASVIAINGNFDDAQALVKKAFNDKDFQCFNLSSANSINIGRLLPQIVYYFYSYLKMLENKEIQEGEKINFCVPTGNFGDILAGYLAKEMGLPINKLICASNDNKVLTDFFETKEYNRNREFIKTISPSMDILISSNLERLLYFVTKDDKLVANLMNDLDTKGFYQIPEQYHEKFNCFVGGYATENETMQNIKKVFDENGYLIDTHTAVAYAVFKKYQNDSNDQTKTIVLSTANPYKFPKAILSALGENQVNDEFEAIKKVNKMTNAAIPQVILSLKETFEKCVWEKEDSYNNLKSLLKEMSE